MLEIHRVLSNNFSSQTPKYELRKITYSSGHVCDSFLHGAFITPVPCKGAHISETGLTVVLCAFKVEILVQTDA